VSTIGGAFNQKVIAIMSRINDRPVVLAISNPTAHAECTPEQAYTCNAGASWQICFSSVGHLARPRGPRFFPGCSKAEGTPQLEGVVV